MGGAYLLKKLLRQCLHSIKFLPLCIFPYFENHSRSLLLVQIIVTSSAFTPTIRYGSISLCATRRCLLSIAFLFSPASVWTVSAQIFNIRSFVGGMLSIDDIACMTLFYSVFLVFGDLLYLTGTDHVLFTV